MGHAGKASWSFVGADEIVDDRGYNRGERVWDDDDAKAVGESGAEYLIFAGCSWSLGEKCGREE
jgi:hypothetical protein